MTDDVILDIVIIGAGISGLAAARAAHKTGQHRPAWITNADRSIAMAGDWLGGLVAWRH